MESALFRGDPTRKIRVVCQSSDSPHKVASVEALAARLCSLTGRHLLPTLQSFDENNGTFFVPTFALVRQDGHPEMSIENFYGGIVHHGFMATKLVTHPHWHDDDNLPEGWAGNFAAWLQDCVLPGFSVFFIWPCTGCRWYPAEKAQGPVQKSLCVRRQRPDRHRNRSRPRRISGNRV